MGDFKTKREREREREEKLSHFLQVNYLSQSSWGPSREMHFKFEFEFEFDFDLEKKEPLLLLFWPTMELLHSMKVDSVDSFQNPSFSFSLFSFLSFFLFLDVLIRQLYDKIVVLDFVPCSVCILTSSFEWLKPKTDESI